MSKTRPSYVPPKTLQQAKNDYKKNGPRISTQQSRITARGVQLYERAEKIKEAEKRRKQNAVKKAAREERERDARRRMGIPSPRREAPKVAASQKLLFGFIKVVGVKEENLELRNEEKKEEQGGQDSDVTERNLAAVESEEEYLDDALDDISLLEAIAEERPKNIVDNDTTNQKHPRPAKRRRLQKTTSIQATTSFNSNDFVLAREITWTQDIEAAKTKSFTLETKENQPPAQDTTTDFAPANNRNDVWDDFLLSNTQLEREIGPLPPTIQVDTNISAPAALEAMTYPASSDSFSTLPDSPVLNIATSACSRNIADDTFLFLLSTQDLSFNFSSPETPREAFVTKEQVTSFVDDVMSPPLSPPQPPQNVTAPLTLPAMTIPIPKALTSARSMPPPPLPSRLHSTKPPSPVFPMAAPPSPAFHAKPPQEPSWRAPRRPRSRISFLKPALPIISQNRSKSCSGQGTATTSGVDWMPFDFDLSTQDCREIGV